MNDQPPSIGAQLKALRLRTGLSLADVAKALGKPTSSYQHYEDAYKKPHLSVDLARQLVPVFAPEVEPQEVLALAGITEEAALALGQPDQASAARGPMISPGEVYRVVLALESLLESRRGRGARMSPETKARLIVSTCLNLPILRETVDEYLARLLAGLTEQE